VPVLPLRTETALFIGHFAIALGAKKMAPEVSLGTLFLACQLADLLWPNFVFLGIEQFAVQAGNTVMTPLDFVHYPWSHSLLALAIWSGLFAAGFSVLRRTGGRVAIVIAALVLSHWLLDVITHRPDMPISIGNATRIGLGLWNYPWLAIPLELILFGIGLWVYSRATVAKDRSGNIGFWALVLFLLLVYAANLLGPPPPSVVAVAWSAEAVWILVFWGYWLDRHRTPREAPTA